MKSIKMVKRRQSESAFYLGESTNGHMISVNGYVHSEIFSAKPKEFIGRQTDHRWWDLGSTGGFMGRIWRPGDHISAALAQVMACCLTATSYYLNQYWLASVKIIYLKFCSNLPGVSELIRKHSSTCCLGILNTVADGHLRVKSSCRLIPNPS